MKRLFLLLIFSALLLQACTQTPGSSTKVAATSRHAMVVTAHPAATTIGLDVLKKGGNAADCAVAVQFALAVCYPNAGNLGGGGFLVWRDAKGNALTLDFREKAPAAATRNMFLDENGNMKEGLSTFSLLASGVPGSVDGMWTAHQRMGKLPWNELVQPAVDMARKGFPVTALQAKEMNDFMGDFRRLNPDAASCPLIREDAWKAGDSLKQNDLALTLERIRDRGREGFYSGKTASILVNQMQTGKGLITLQDLADYHSEWREPLRGTYKDIALITMPPPSAGGIILLQLLAMTENFPVKEWGWQTERTVHLMTECERRAFADRSEHVGDPAFHKVPVSSLLDRDYLERRMSDFNPERATPSANVKPGSFVKKEKEETTHFSIVDAEGNAVSLTTTLNGWYGSRIMVRGAGFLLNNEMDDFSAKPGAPNMFGLTGSEANAIEPGKRMVSSMTPIIAEKNGKLLLVLGTPGGATIPTTVYQVFLNVVEHGMNMQDAVARPRFHHQWQPDKIQPEKDAFSTGTLSALKQLGHTVETRASIGRAEGILIRADGTMEGGADPRGDDAAGGW